MARRDSKGRMLKENEYQREDGRYEYMDNNKSIEEKQILY